MRCSRLWPGLGLVISLLITQPAHAVVVAPSPGQQVVMLEERVLMVYDPLTASQTVVVQHTFEGTTAPFGLIIPTPSPARVSVTSERVQRAIRNKLHPRARDRRTLDLEFVWWTRHCAVREVGDGSAKGGRDARPPVARGKPVSVGDSPARLHDWLLAEGFTLAPAQAAWLNSLRDRGWSVVAVKVTPSVQPGLPPGKVRGPVLALTHEADEPMYAAAAPPFALTPSAPGPEALLEVGVLSEWAVSPAGVEEAPPFYADSITGRDVARLGAEAGGLPWAFRRDGVLTAFSLPRTIGDGVLRFNRTNPRPRIRPEPTPQLKAHQIQVPVELPLFLLMMAWWLWSRHGRRPSMRTRDRRLRL